MKMLRQLFLRFGGLFNHESKDRELDAEIESHLQLHIEENVRSGLYQRSPQLPLEHQPFNSLASAKIKIGVAIALAAAMGTSVVLQRQKTALWREVAVLRQRESERNGLEEEISRLKAREESTTKERESERAELAGCAAK
jgi:hypothetical protein